MSSCNIQKSTKTEKSFRFCHPVPISGIGISLDRKRENKKPVAPLVFYGIHNERGDSGSEAGMTRTLCHPGLDPGSPSA